MVSGIEGIREDLFGDSSIRNVSRTVIGNRTLNSAFRGK